MAEAKTTKCVRSRFDAAGKARPKNSGAYHSTVGRVGYDTPVDVPADEAKEAIEAGELVEFGSEKHKAQGE